MWFLPPNEFWYHTAVRLTVTCDDNRVGSGTGFFVLHADQYYLLTARHVVDPTYLPAPKKRQARCVELEFRFRGISEPGTDHFKVMQMGRVCSNPNFIFPNSDVDLALLAIPSDVLPGSGKSVSRPLAFGFNFLATQEDLSKRYAGEPVVFVGYPDNAPVLRGGDAEQHYPILRQGVFAYPPIHGIEVEGELGRDYGLIDSYAQSGFSGGPVVSLQRGFEDGGSPEDFRRSTVVGLMCGHYRSKEDRADGTHAGLSFFVRSTSLVSVIEQSDTAE